MVELRAAVMRPDLERLGRYDDHRVRRRFLDAYRAEHTTVIEADGIPVGLFAVRPEPNERWFEHLYLRELRGKAAKIKEKREPIAR